MYVKIQGINKQYQIFIKHKIFIIAGAGRRIGLTIYPFAAGYDCCNHSQSWTARRSKAR
jgi:hypothetical protein